MISILVSLFKYKAWANAELHAALAKFDALQHPSEFRTMLRTLDHANVTDRIFKGHLIGTTPVFKATHSLNMYQACRSCVRLSAQLMTAVALGRCSKIWAPTLRPTP